MRKVVCLLFLVVVFNCNNNVNLTHSETAQKVVEAFYQGNDDELRKHTTKSGYTSLMMVKAAFPDSSEKSNFKVENDTVIGVTAWVRFRTDYSDRSETFKLVREEGAWKVTHKKLREPSPF